MKKMETIYNSSMLVLVLVIVLVLVTRLNFKPPKKMNFLFYFSKLAHKFEAEKCV